MRDAGTAAYLQTYRQAAQQRRNISFNPNFPPKTKIIIVVMDAFKSRLQLKLKLLK